MAVGQSMAPRAVQVQVPPPSAMPTSASMPSPSSAGAASAAGTVASSPGAAAAAAPVVTPTPARPAQPAQVRLSRAVMAASTGAAPPAPATAAASALALASVSAPRRQGGSLKETSPRQRADAGFARAVQQLQEARGSDARQSLQDALEHDPSHGDARLLLAALLIEDRQLARAETLLVEGLSRSPSAAQVSALARLKVERGEDGAAVDLLLAHENEVEEAAGYQALLAALLLRAERPADAARHYQRALALGPGPAAWWAGLGLALSAQLGLEADALRTLRQALAVGDLQPSLRDRVEQTMARLQRQEPKR